MRRKLPVVHEDLLDDESGDSLAQLRACLHNPETQRNDLRLQEKVDHTSIVHFDESTDDPKRRQSQVLKGPGLGGGVEEGIQIERNMGFEEQRASLRV